MESKWCEIARELNIPLCDGEHESLGCERERAKELLIRCLKSIRESSYLLHDKYDSHPDASGKCECPDCSWVLGRNAALAEVEQLLEDFV